jgi:hypothetical protein
VIHRPHVKAESGKYVHRRIFAGAGNREVERRQRRIGRAVDEEENGAGRLAWSRCADTLAVAGEQNIALW